MNVFNLQVIFPLYIPAMRDYLNILDNVIRLADNHPMFSDFASSFELGSGFLVQTLLFLFESAKFVCIYTISFQWLKDLIYLPTIIPQINYNIFTENVFLESLDSSYFSFLELPQYTNSKFLLGLINSFFLCLPVSLSSWVVIRAVMLEGISLGILASVVTMTGQFLFIAAIILGNRFFVIPWAHFHITQYVLGLFLAWVGITTTIRPKVLYDTQGYPITKKVKQHRKSVVYSSFLISVSEKAMLFLYFSNLSVGAEPSAIESFATVNQSSSTISTLTYLFGLLVGSFSFSVLFMFPLIHFRRLIWRNRLRLLGNAGYGFVSFFFNGILICWFGLACLFYSADYLVLSNLGIIQSEKSVTSTVFSYPNTLYEFDPKNENKAHAHVLSHPYEYRDKGFLVNLDLSRFSKSRYLLFELHDGFETLNYRSEAALIQYMRRIPTASQPPSRFPLVQLIRNAYVSLRDTAINPETKAKQAIRPKIKTKRRLYEEQHADELEKLSITGEYSVENYDFDYALRRFSPLFVDYSSSSKFLENELEKKSDVIRPFRRRYYNNPIYRALLSIDIDSFLARQPRDFRLSPTQEVDLFTKRRVLAKYYDTLRYYDLKQTFWNARFFKQLTGKKNQALRKQKQKQPPVDQLSPPVDQLSPPVNQLPPPGEPMPMGFRMGTNPNTSAHYYTHPRDARTERFWTRRSQRRNKENKKKAGYRYHGAVDGSRSFADRVYNHQFKGTFNMVKRLFSINVKLPDFTKYRPNIGHLDANNMLGSNRPYNEDRKEIPSLITKNNVSKLVITDPENREKPSEHLILKFDQPLYAKKKANPPKFNPFLHEELAEKDRCFSNPDKECKRDRKIMKKLKQYHKSHPNTDSKPDSAGPHHPESSNFHAESSNFHAESSNFHAESSNFQHQVDVSQSDFKESNPDVSKFNPDISKSNPDVSKSNPDVSQSDFKESESKHSKSESESQSDSELVSDDSDVELDFDESYLPEQSDGKKPDHSYDHAKYEEIFNSFPEGEYRAQFDANRKQWEIQKKTGQLSKVQVPIHRDDQNVDAAKPYLEQIHSFPFYFGWDEQQRKLVVTHRLAEQAMGSEFARFPNQPYDYTKISKFKFGTFGINFTLWPRKILPVVDADKILQQEKADSLKNQQTAKVKEQRRKDKQIRNEQRRKVGLPVETDSESDDSDSSDSDTSDSDSESEKSDGSKAESKSAKSEKSAGSQSESDSSYSESDRSQSDGSDSEGEKAEQSNASEKKKKKKKRRSGSGGSDSGYNKSDSEDQAEHDSQDVLESQLDNSQDKVDVSQSDFKQSDNSEHQDSDFNEFQDSKDDSKDGSQSDLQQSDDSKDDSEDVSQSDKVDGSQSDFQQSDVKEEPLDPNFFEKSDQMEAINRDSDDTESEDSDEEKDTLEKTKAEIAAQTEQYLKGKKKPRQQVDTNFQVMQRLAEKAQTKNQAKELRGLLRRAKADPYSQQGLREIKDCRKVHFGRPNQQFDRGGNDLLQAFLYYTKYPPSFYFTRAKTGISKKVMRGYMLDDDRFGDLEEERGYVFATPMCNIANAGKVEEIFELTPRRGGAYWPGFNSNLFINFFDINFPDKIIPRIQDEFKRRPLRRDLNKMKEKKRQEKQKEKDERRQKRQERQQKRDQRQQEYNEIK